MEKASNLPLSEPLETPLDDRELVQKLIAKDPKAERLFYDTYHERVYRVCVYVLGPGDPEAEDVAQEAFIAALRQMAEFEFRSTLYRWLYRIAIYLCYDRIRKRRRQVAHEDGELEALSSRHSVDKERVREEESQRKKVIEFVRAQRDLMGEPCQGLLKLRDEEEKSYADIAETLKIPIGTVMSRLARCKEALKQLILSALGEGSLA